jgi:bifunctional non-homologous end joining protein LigD
VDLVVKPLIPLVGRSSSWRIDVIRLAASRPGYTGSRSRVLDFYSMSAPSIVEVDGRKLKLSNLEKILYPDAAFTKGQVVDFYVRIAPVLLPHLAGRPLTMKRYPEGVDQEFFFEKNAPLHRPDWVKTAPIWSESNHRTIHFILANDLPTLVWIANLASIELHPSLSLAADIAAPTMIVFDLDPGPPANVVQCAQVGLWVRAIFDHFGLQSFPKTSGSKGLQIYVPLNTKTSYDQTKSFAHAVARLLEQEHPDMVVSDMKKAVRTNRVFVDWSQNDQHKTTISVYSLRAREQPTVSTPVTWQEVEQALKRKDAARLVFEAEAVLARVEKLGDLFEPVQKLKQTLPQLAGLSPESEKERDDNNDDEKTVSVRSRPEARPPAKKKKTKAKANSKPR